MDLRFLPEPPQLPRKATCHPERSFRIRCARIWAQQTIRTRVEGPAVPAGAATTPAESEKPVILSEASEYVAPAFGRNKQFRREPNGPAVPAGTTTTPAESEKPVILSEASKYVAPAFGRNKQFRRESKDLLLGLTG
jgi:hypothetical protein